MQDFSSDKINELQKKLEVQFRQDFVDECRQKIENISSNLEQLAVNEGDPQSHILGIRGETHSIKGMGASLGFPGITVIAHRMEDFLSERTEVPAQAIKDFYLFIDKIQELLAMEIQPSSDEISEIVRTLPIQHEGAFKDQDQKYIEVLSVMPKTVQQRMINKELRACGFHVSSLDSSLEAINISLNTKPDLIVVSALVDMISGLELSGMIRAVGAMADTPIIIVTSFDELRLRDSDLPPKVVIARKGMEFAEDLSDCLLELGIMK